MKIMALTAFVALAVSAMGETGAAERFRPAAPDFVVLQVPARASNDPIAVLEQRVALSPEDQSSAAELAALYVQRARERREMRYFGRAETLLQPWVGRLDALSATLRVQADILQNRHDFAGALVLLDRAIRRDSRDVSARLMRASIHLVQGKLSQARGDCAVVLGAGESAVGTACLAQVLGDSGQLEKAQALLETVLARQELRDELRGWMYGLQADFADRVGNRRRAESLLREAMKVTPANEGVRSMLADLLIDRGALREALAIVDLPAPSIGLLARKARIQTLSNAGGLDHTRAQIEGLLSLAERRGERPHLREEALIALDVERDAERALTLAKQNFEVQRETVDLRLLARAARARGDREGLEIVARWMRETGFEDSDIARARS